MQLFVRGDSGRTLVLAVDSKATIADVAALCNQQQQQQKRATARLDDDARPRPRRRDLVAPMPTTPMAEHYLWYGGVPLRPHRTLQDYGIQNHATLETCVRLRGGCFAFSIMVWIAIFVLCLLSVCTCGLSLPVALCLIPIALLLPLCCL